MHSNQMRATSHLGTHGARGALGGSCTPQSSAALRYGRRPGADPSGRHERRDARDAGGGRRGGRSTVRSRRLGRDSDGRREALAGGGRAGRPRPRHGSAGGHAVPVVLDDQAGHRDRRDEARRRRATGPRRAGAAVASRVSARAQRRSFGPRPSPAVAQLGAGQPDAAALGASRRPAGSRLARAHAAAAAPPSAAAIPAGAAGQLLQPRLPRSPPGHQEACGPGGPFSRRGHRGGRWSPLQGARA